MVNLAPAPNTLHLASPALGPWFANGAGQLPQLPLPSGDMSVPITLGTNMEWHVPAVCTRSYFVANNPRPAGLLRLCKENRSPAFTTNNLVVLLTLLPEVEERLWALTQPIPNVDGSALAPANTPARPRVRWLAAEIAISNIPNITSLENILPANFPADLTTDQEKAAYLGLTFSNGTFISADKPATILGQPNHASSIALTNRTGMQLRLTLWCFDYRGRALDPGAVASWWTYMMSTGIWDNLAAGASQQTAAVTAGKVVQLVSPHEGPVPATLRNRLTLTGFTQVVGSSNLYTVDQAAAIAQTAAPTPDDAPLARIANLPNGTYGTIAAATPFAGWNGNNWPTLLARDFLQVSVVELEQHLVGLSRANATQADARLRVSPARNTTAAPLLLTTDAVNTNMMAILTAGAGARVMSPVMDALWGSLLPAPLDANVPPASLVFSAHALAGEGATAGGSVAQQQIAIRFAPGALPANCWIRIWPHGRDTATGHRFRMDGGGGRSDAAGEAHLVLTLPDGTAAPATVTCDAIVVTGNASQYYTDLRIARPVTVAGTKVTLAAPPATPAAARLWMCELGAVMPRSGGQYRSGVNLLVVPNDTVNGTYALVDLTSLVPADIGANALPNAGGAGDTLITTAPAFQATPEGDLPAGAQANGAARVHRARNGLAAVLTMGQPAASMERTEHVSLERTTNTGVIGATPARAVFHENLPLQQGNPGAPGAEDIHSTGLALAGPATDQMVAPMVERSSINLPTFLQAAAVPIGAAADPGGTACWTTVLETLTHGVTGDEIVRGFLAVSTFQPGQSWVQTKNDMEAALGIDIDALIDTATFDDDTLAAAIDRVLHKTKNGLTQFARSLQAAIGRAEDFIYLETPVLDDLTTSGNTIDIIGAIKQRWTQHPHLVVLLCVPEEFLPDQITKLQDMRKRAIAAALKSLSDQGKERVRLFSPIAGSGRPLYMASTSAVIDDAILFCGSTHLWRRGLTFDSSLAASLFDERQFSSRPAGVRLARQQMLGAMLGAAVNLIPDDVEDCLSMVKQLSSGSGMGRIKPGVHVPATDPTSDADKSIWNPDGTSNIGTGWQQFFASLAGTSATEFTNAIR